MNFRKTSLFLLPLFLPFIRFSSYSRSDFNLAGFGDIAEIPTSGPCTSNGVLSLSDRGNIGSLQFAPRIISIRLNLFICRQRLQCFENLGKRIDENSGSGCARFSAILARGVGISWPGGRKTSRAHEEEQLSAAEIAVMLLQRIADGPLAAFMVEFLRVLRQIRVQSLISDYSRIFELQSNFSLRAFS